MCMAVIGGRACYEVTEGTPGAWYYCGAWYLAERSEAGRAYYREYTRALMQEQA